MQRETRSDIYRRGDARVDVKFRHKDWFVRVRVWQGGRWPKVDRVFYARRRKWLPWFSLERQAVRAVEHANRRMSVHVPRDAVVRQVRGALRMI